MIVQSSYALRQVPTRQLDLGFAGPENNVLFTVDGGLTVESLQLE
jgi:hypothetical protein